MMSAYIDGFARTQLPPTALWPEIDSSKPPLKELPQQLNAAAWLLDRRIEAGFGDRPAIRFADQVWTYGDVQNRAERIARVLTENLGLVPGNRVLLHSPNTPMMVAAWFAVLKAGGICVATMPLLRARELGYICDKAKITLALCDLRLGDELKATQAKEPGLRHVMRFTALGDGQDPAAELDAAMAGKAPGFANVPTAADDVAIIAFTSGTTGPAKGTMHFHRDLVAVCDCFPKLLDITPDDLFTGTPPLAFTFGLGALLLFPFSRGASVLLQESFTPEKLLEAVQKYRVTGLYTAPTAYRAMSDLAGKFDLSSLRLCVSAGEHLPQPTWERWRQVTGLRIVDGIGATEMLHIFIAAAGDDIRPGATGKAVPGYEACILGDDGFPVPPGTLGRLAVKGPTGCRYLDNLERQQAYVKNGWNLTGDVYQMDADGYFWYQARSDDMIISAGYNISGIEVENVLLDHPKVAECAVIGVPDPDRGQVVKAFVVLRDAALQGEATTKELQDYVKAQIAPYKYPRQIDYRDSLPRTLTGKLQRFMLR